jgi:hypothetical protein
MNWSLAIAAFCVVAGALLALSVAFAWITSSLNENYRGWHSIALFLVGSALVGLGVGAS